LRNYGSCAVEKKHSGRIIGVVCLDYPGEWTEPEISVPLIRFGSKSGAILSESTMANKHELINSLRTIFNSWEEVLAGMSEEEITAQPRPRKWSVSEVITHLRAWQQISVAHLEAALLNTEPNFPAWLDGADPFYAENHVDKFNARIQERQRFQPWPKRHREWREGFLRFLDLAEAVPDSIMFDEKRHSWLRGNALAAVLEGSCEHHQHHLDCLRNSPRTTMGPRTRVIHSRATVPSGFTSLVTPIFRGSTTVFKNAADLRDTWDHYETPYTYGSYGTPTTLELAARIAELEKGRRTFITPGGQIALILVYFACLSAGDHVLIPESVYGPSRAFADYILRRLNIDVEYYPPLEGPRIASRLKTNTRLIWCESPGSITMEVQDVPAIAEAAHEKGVTVALDNTWAAGVCFDAFSHGVDVSVQALTKYVGGHSDLLLGSVTVRDDALYQRIGATHQHFGLAVSPDDCSLALRGLQTLFVRLKAIEQTSLKVAAWLAERPEVEIVLHPAFPSCPGHETWQRDFTGSSGLFSVVFRPPLKRADLHAFMDRLSLFRMGYSWGGVTSLVVTPDLNEAPNARVYGDRLVRFYTGLEDPDDLIHDLEQALGSILQRAGT
jgi:cysteine-S-conjugate beta-lyase